MPRRRFLARAAALASTLAAAGCQGAGPGSGPTGGPATTTDTATTATDSTTATATDTATTVRVRDVSFEAPHGATIRATAYGRGSCGVVLVPQANRDRASWRSQAATIAGMGHLALAIDEDPENRPASVRGAIRYLRRQRDVSTLVLVGASTGGEAVVVANADADVAVDGTVALSPAGGVDRAPELRGRSLFVVSEGDEARFVRVARRLYERAPEPKTLVRYEGSAHGQGLVTSNRGDELRGRLRAFVADVCGG